jgi:predicted oxidoreductase (fatty acid repression mutant protein)
MYAGQKTTYIDDAVKAKRGIPDAKYEVSGTLLFGKNKNSQIEKS